MKQSTIFFYVSTLNTAIVNSITLYLSPKKVQTIGATADEREKYFAKIKRK